jgi:hypothetical protein
MRGGFASALFSANANAAALPMPATPPEPSETAFHPDGGVE